jgi:hypothetical protein
MSDPEANNNPMDNVALNEMSGTTNTTTTTGVPYTTRELERLLEILGDHKVFLKRLESKKISFKDRKEVIILTGADNYRKWNENFKSNIGHFVLILTGRVAEPQSVPRNDPNHEVGVNAQIHYLEACAKIRIALMSVVSDAIKLTINSEDSIIDFDYQLL